MRGGGGGARGGELTRKVGVIGAARLVATSATALVIGMYLSRRLEPTDYGTFQQAWFLTHMLIEVALLGFPVGILYFLPRMTRPERRGFLLRVTFLLALIGAVLALGLVSAAGPLSRLFGNDALRSSLRILALYALFVVPGIPMDSFLIAQNRHRLFGAITVAHSILLVVAVVIPAAAGLALSAILWGVAAYGIVRAGLFLAGAASTVRGVESVYRRGVIQRFVAYSLPVALSGVCRVASRWLDKSLVSAFFDPKTFAIYANGAVEIPVVGVLVGAISSVVLPEFSRLSGEGKREGVLELWRRTIVKAGALVIPLFVFLMVFATPFLVVLFSRRYEASAGPFRIYLLLLPLRSGTYAPLLLALGRSRLVAVGALADLLFNLGLSLALIPHFGYNGPAIATVASTYGQATFYVWSIGRILETPRRRLLPWASIGRLFLLAALPALLLVPLLRTSLSPLPLLAAGAVAYFLPVALLLWRFGPLSEADREQIRALLRKVRRSA